MSKGRTLTLYRDDSTAQVRYDRVKSYFFTANNTVLTISRYDAEDGDGHHYIHWPRERFCWFRDAPANASAEPQRAFIQDRRTGERFDTDSGMGD